MKLLFLLSVLLIPVASEMFDIFGTEFEIDAFLKSGSQFGYFTYKEFLDWFRLVRQDEQNVRYLSPLFKIGHSYNFKDIKAFCITDNNAEIEQELAKKNIVFLTALHHSREPLSLTMIIYMVIEILKHLRSTRHNRFHEFLRDNNICMIPVINVDSYIYINENWQTSEGQKNDDVLMIRKNRRIDEQCDEISGGVDLNRNYSYKFALDDKGSSPEPCAEDYRGSFPFSEPETQAVRDFVEKHPTIVSGVNIHSYGNDWIYPYNYLEDKQDSLLKKTRKPIFEFLKEFQKKCQDKDKTLLFGNASFTLDYETNGEAGDWLTGAKKILNLDLELGNKDPQSNQFYPPKSIISRIVRYNFITMSEFLLAHIIHLQLKMTSHNLK